MKKIHYSWISAARLLWRSKLLRTMRLTLFAILVSVVQIFATNVHAQQTRLSLNMKNTSIRSVLGQIENQTGFYFIYNAKAIDVEKEVSIDVENESIPEILDKIFEGTNVAYKIDKRQIAISTNLAENAVQQEVTVSGRVTDSSGAPLPGVTVVIKGTTKGTITDGDGNYLLKDIPSDGTLVFSFVGMKSQEVFVTGKSVVNIQLEEDAIGIGEVVAVGYGVQQARYVTGSVGSISTERLKEQPVGTVLQKMQGQIAGVQINQTSGTPGSGMTIRIRGAASVSAGNQPLYVVDGFPIVGDLNNINPNEIENISILKGTAASSLYGSRAANGVVLITTKQAKEGTPVQLDVEITSGIGVVPENLKPNVLDAKGFLTHMQYLWEDRVKYQGYSPSDIPDIFKNPDAYNGPDTDWYDELLRTSGYKEASLTLSSGTGKIRTTNVATIHDEKGTVLNTNYKRFSLRSNNLFKVNDNITVGMNLAPTYVTKDGSGSDGRHQILFNAITTPPIFDPNELGPDGKIVGSFANAPAPLWRLPNPKKTLLETTNVTEQLQLYSNAFVEVGFLKDFKLKSSVSAEINLGQNRQYNPSTVGPRAWSPPPRTATAYENRDTHKSWVWENSLSYNKTFSKDHNIEALLVYSAQETRADWLTGNANTYADDEIPYLSAGTNRTSTTGVAEWSLASVLGRLNYNYKERYLLSAAFRRDGSSRFGADERWGSFPSVSLGWIISQEGFMKNIPAVSFLKLRAEYGKSGNFDIGNYSHLGGVSAENYVFNGTVTEGRRQSSLGNSSLTWETTVGTGVGLDLGLLKDRFTFTFDYYKKTTDGLLYQVDIPLGTGFGNIQSNIGEFDFWGYEFSVTSRNLVGNFKWNTSFNISFDRNKTIKLGTNNEPIGGGGGGIGENKNKTVVGHPMGMFWGFVSDGIYETQEELDSEPKAPRSVVGSVKFKDLNGDGEITFTEDDRTFLGNPQPKFIYGMTNNFSYKDFDLGITIAGSYGNKMMYGFYEWTTLLEGLFNVEDFILDRWRSPENPGSGDVPSTANGASGDYRQIHSRWISDGSYLAIKNITLGYNLPKLKSIIKKARIYGSIQQAFVFTKYPGVNPEATNLSGIPNGIDSGNYPIPRTYVFGLNVTF